MGDGGKNESRFKINCSSSWDKKEKFNFLDQLFYFLWVNLKSKMYVERSHTLKRVEVAAVTSDMMRETINFKARLKKCDRNGGRHLLDIIFKIKLCCRTENDKY